LNYIRKFIFIMAFAGLCFAADAEETPDRALENAVLIGDYAKIAEAIKLGAGNANYLLGKESDRYAPRYYVIRALMEGGAKTDTNLAERALERICRSGDWEQFGFLDEKPQIDWLMQKQPYKEIHLCGNDNDYSFEKCCLEVYEIYGKEMDIYYIELNNLRSSAARNNDAKMISLADDKLAKLRAKYKIIEIKKSDRDSFIAREKECDAALTAEGTTPTAERAAELMKDHIRCSAKIGGDIMEKYYKGFDMPDTAAAAEIAISSACAGDKCDTKKLSDYAKTFKRSVYESLDNSRTTIIIITKD